YTLSLHDALPIYRTRDHLRLQQSRRRFPLALLDARSRLPRHFRCDPFRATARRRGRFHFGRRGPRPSARARRDRGRLRRHFHGGARKPRARIVGWAEPDSAKAVAEASPHVKSYSCCRFVAVAPDSRAPRSFFCFSLSWVVSRLPPRKRARPHRRKPKRS